MIVVCIMGNLIVCLIVYQKTAMRSAINLLLANMAMSNMLLSIFGVTFFLATLVAGKWIFGEIVCRIIGCLQMFFIGAGVFIMLTISVDRYLIIVHRKDKLTQLRAKVFIAISWISSILLAFPPVIGWEKYVFYKGQTQCMLKINEDFQDLLYILLCYSILFFLPMATMAYCFFCIIKTVRKNSMKIHNQADQITVSVTMTSSRLNLPVIVRPHRINVDMSFKTRTFKTILILYLWFVICWSPFAVATLVLNLTKTHNSIVTTVLLWLGYLNSALNPVIYALRIKKFREACLEIAPYLLKFAPRLSRLAKRRVNPGSAYECQEAPVPPQ